MRVGSRTAVVAGAAGFAMVLAACGGVTEDDGGPSSAPSGSIVIGGCNPENPLIPMATNEVCGGNPLDAMFSGLIRYDPETGEAVNEIAQSIESEDNQVWRVTLRDGWTFHDGTPITAQSFVDAWSWGVHGENSAYGLNEYFFEPIEGYEESRGEFDDNGDYVPGSGSETLSGLEVIDDRTFTITLNAPEAGFPLRLGYTAFFPLPEAFYADPEAFGQQPIGSGPFRLVGWDQNQSIQLEAYEGYQGDVKPRAEQITFRMYQQQDAQYADLLADNVDVVTQLPPSALAGEAYRADLGDRYIEREAGVIQTITFASPEVNPEVDDANLRKAVSLAINRELIIQNIFQGQYTAATGWVSPVVEGYLGDQCGEFCVYDAELAKTYLADSGFDGPIIFGYNGDGGHDEWVNAACNSISNALEIECRAQAVPLFAEFREQINARETGDMTMFRTGWQMDYPSIENFLTPLYATGASANDGDYSNEQFDDLVRQAAQAQDDEALELYQQAERVLAEDMPVIPLWYGKTIAGYSTRVDPDSVSITPFGTLDLLSITGR
ncbi:MAG TPA: ABC transporter substrate-binding protein [Jiangellaceae bacterium]|nr:ABC transporter substrate-binding protein [Jiangellaceae bacterium]